jgi:hypothetical protein
MQAVEYRALMAVLNIANKMQFKADYFFARQADQVRRLHERQDKRAPAVLAIYIGWRGESVSKEWFNVLTFADRAKVADRIGSHREKDGVRAVLLEISKSLAKAGPDGRMLVTGHSLGGRALAMAFLQDVGQAASHPLDPLGKNALIALLEPAIGADCFAQVLKQADPIAKPFMVSISSKDDVAIGPIYELGRMPPILRTPTCHETEPGNDQVIGNYKKYVTHTLNFVHETPDEDKADGKFGPFVKLKPSPGYAVYNDGDPPAFVVRANEGPWFLRPGKRSLAYPSHEKCSENPNPNCPSDRNDLYTMRFHEAKGTKNSRFWNIQTDRDTIDSPENPSRASGLHNFVSTNLARLFAEFLYPE